MGFYGSAIHDTSISKKSVFDLLHKVRSSGAAFMTLDQMMEQCKLNFTVAKRPIFYLGVDGNIAELNTHKATVREDNNAALGVVSSNYGVCQNNKSLSMTEVMVKEGSAQYAYSGVVGQGERLFVIMQTGDHLDLGGGDGIECYFFITTTHDGTGFVDAIPAWYRPVTGTVSIVPGVKGLRFRHSKNVEENITKAHAVIDKIRSYWQATKDKFPLLAQARVTDEEARSYFEAIFDGDSTRSQNVRDQLYVLYKTGMGAKLPSTAGTILGCYFAVVNYVDHYMTTRKSKKRDDNSSAILSKLMGDGAERKAQAWATMVAFEQRLGDLTIPSMI